MFSSYYLRVEPERYLDTISGGLIGVIQQTVHRARTRTSTRVFKRIMETGPDGTPRLREMPPVLQHVGVDVETQLIESFQEYLAGVPADAALLLSHFRVTDIALQVVGVGSVGAGCAPIVAQPFARRARPRPLLPNTVTYICGHKPPGAHTTRAHPRPALGWPRGIRPLAPTRQRAIRPRCRRPPMAPDRR
jgi:Uncharacterized protein conserved in bacteria (DUF2252)